MGGQALYGGEQWWCRSGRRGTREERGKTSEEVVRRSKGLVRGGGSTNSNTGNETFVLPNG